MGVTMVAMDTWAWDVSMARGLLMLMLIPTTMVDSMDMVWATMVATVLDTMDWDVYGKRSADADAKPAADPYYGYGLGLGYGGYYGHGYGLGYRGYYWG